jgi:hypothetical protein
MTDTMRLSIPTLAFATVEGRALCASLSELPDAALLRASGEPDVTIA